MIAFRKIRSHVMSFEGQKIQQVLEPGSSNEIGEASIITVWGKKTGDRFIAEIVVYSPPGFSTK